MEAKDSMEDKVKIKKHSGEMTREEALALLEKGKKVSVAPARKKDRMSLYNVRLRNETIDRLAEIGEKKGVTPSAVARQILEDGVNQNVDRLERLTSRIEAALAKQNSLQGDSADRKIRK